MNYYELKGVFMRACERHQEGNGNEDAISLCSSCRYGADNGNSECFAHWMFDVLSGNFAKTDKLTEYRTLTERKSANVTGEIAENDEKSPNACKKTAHDAKLPVWCKVGQWVLINNTLCKIAAVTDDPYYPITFNDVHGQYGFAHPREICPIRFRPYKRDEAKGLLGKVMEYEVGTSKHKYCAMITVVGEDGDDVCINWNSHEYWNKWNATIDGIPIGVPEVDEELMGGGEAWTR